MADQCFGDDGRDRRSLAGLTTLPAPGDDLGLVLAAGQSAIWPGVKPGIYCAPVIALDGIDVFSF